MKKAPGALTPGAEDLNLTQRKAEYDTTLSTPHSMGATMTDYADDPFAEGNAEIDRGELMDTDRPTRHLRGQGVIDPRDGFKSAPQFSQGHLLPGVFMTYVADCCASWGGDPGAYACGFTALHCSVLHESVVMNTNPLKPNNWRRPNDFSLTVGKSGDNKSGMWRDLTKFQTAWQQAMTRSSAAARVGSKTKKMPPACFLQTASIEGVMAQLADNEGERLLIGAEEAMLFYGGAAAHHGDNSVTAMSDAVCTIYDGGMFTKRLVNKVFNIPSALATVITTTVAEKISGWKQFNMMVESGLMARHTVGIISHPVPRDPDLAPSTAEADMAMMLLKLRGLRNVRARLAPDAATAWLKLTPKLEKRNADYDAQDIAPGLVAWARKYDMRIMSIATILQLYEYVEGGCMDHETSEEFSNEADAGKTDGGKKVVQTILVSRENLSRALEFYEKYLLGVQIFFYEVAAGISEYGKEVMNFLAYRIAIDDPDDPECRIMSRDTFTWSGPAAVRRGTTDQRREKARRWIGTLMDFGIIEVYDHPNARKLKQRRADEDERWYKVRDEVFEKFGPEREVFIEHNRAMRKRMSENGIGNDRTHLTLD